MVVLRRREFQFLQMVVRLDVVPDALGNQFYQPVQPNGVAGTQLLCPAVGVELTAQIIHPFFPLFPIGGLAHGAAAVRALHKARQGVHHAGAVLPGANVQIPLDGLKGLPVDDGLVSALHPEPAVPGHDDDGLGFVAGLFGPALHHDAGVDLITEDPPYGVLVPEPEILLAEVVAVPAPLRLILGGINHPQIVEHVGDTLLAVALQGPAEDLPHYLCRLRVHQEMALVVRVLSVAIDGKAADVLPLPPLHVKDHADVLRQVLQIPLVDESIDLAGFFVALDLRVGVVCHSDEADSPDGKQAVDVLLHQFHVPGKPGLALAEEDLKLLFLGRPDHPVEVRPQAVGPRVVLIAIDVVDVPSPLHGVVDQQGLLVLDTLGFLLLFVFVLLTQSCIDRTKNMSHLLKGVTAHFHLSTESSDTARNYLKSLRRQNAA